MTGSLEEPGACSVAEAVQAPEDLKQCVRDDVVLAAGSAMEGAQWFMAVVQKGVSAISSCPSLLERKTTRVMVAFWDRLRGFRSLGLSQRGGALVGPCH